MKKLKISLFILFAVMIIILVFFLVKNKKNTNKLNKINKVISEINYIDRKLTFLLNNINNIKIDINEQTLKYELKETGIIKREGEVKWNDIKNDVETIYNTIPIMTLDLYSININQENILNFNKELDELTIAVKDENKERTLVKLANLYRYLPTYASSFSDDIEYVCLLETKSNIFNEYVFVNLDKWEEAQIYNNNAIESYSRVLNNIKKNSDYDINKIYITLNEMQNAINIKNKDVFYIKYKYLVEEIIQIKS